MKYLSTSSKHKIVSSNRAQSSLEMITNDTTVDLEKGAVVLLGPFDPLPSEDLVKLEGDQGAAKNRHISDSYLSSSGSMSTAWSPQQGHNKCILTVLTVLIILLGAAASSAFLWIGIVGAKNESKRGFVEDAMELTNAVKAALDDYEMFGFWIHEACHLVQENPSVDPSEDIASHAGFCSREKFQHVYEYIESVGLEFVAIQYIPNVTDAEREYVEEESRKFHLQRNPNMPYVGFKALELSPTDGSVVSLGPSPTKPWYFPMHYLLPLEKNENAVDIDLYSYREREIEQTFKTGKPLMGTRARLFQDPDPRVYGIEFIHPGIRTHRDTGRDVRPGLSKLVIKVPSLVERAAKTFLKNCRVYLFDESNPNEEPIFLAGADLVGDQVTLKQECLYSDVPSASKTFIKSITVMDKEWRIVVQPIGDTYKEHHLSFVILGGVLIFVACIIIVFWFHTHMNRLAKENRIKSKAEAEKSQLALDQAKRERHLNDFLAHEVRNPLSSAIAALSFVCTTAQDRVEDPEARTALLEDIKIVDGSLEYINDLLKNMLDIHKSSCNEMKLEITSSNLKDDIFEPVAKILVPRCGNVQTIVDCPPNLFANIDRLRMKQVILNLAINATKFVENGYIRLRAEVVNDSICIFVEDSGPGIPLQKRDLLFKKFQESLDLRNQGTGIGLYVCKNLTKLMGASIDLDEAYQSELPDCPGARFVLDLHQAPIYNVPSSYTVLDVSTSASSTPSTLEETVASSVVGGSGAFFTADPVEENGDHPDTTSKTQAFLPDELSVLFVDDDFVLRKLFARTVARVKPNWKIEHACYGEAALELVEGKSYDIIFMDQYMASDEKMLLGTETVVKLRNEKHVKCLICGLSANDLEEQFLDAGANAFMTKPFPCEKKALERELIRIMGREEE